MSFPGISRVLNGLKGAGEDADFSSDTQKKKTKAENPTQNQTKTTTTKRSNLG